MFNLSLSAQKRYFEQSGLVFTQTAVSEIRIEIRADYLDYILRPQNSQSDKLFPARFIFKNAEITGDTVENVGFRLRGNTSRDAQKKSFKVDFNHFQRGRDFYGLEKMNINGEHNDPAIMRSMACWKLFELAEIPASRSTYAALFINDRFKGLYVVVEHIDDEFVKARYPGPLGNLYKCLWPADLDTITGSNPDRYKFSSYGRQAYALKTNREADDYSDLTKFIDFLSLSDDARFAREIEEIFNVRGYLRYLALNTLVGMWDDYWFLKNNYYLYHNMRSNRFEFIPYDYDNTYGIDWFNIDWAARDIYNFGPLDGVRPLVQRILAIPAYKNLYAKFIDEFINGIFKKSSQDVYFLGWRILAAPFVQIDPFYSADYQWTYNNHWQNALTQPAGDFVKYGMYDYIDRRITTARSQVVVGTLPLKITAYSLSNPKPLVGELVTIRTAVSTNDAVQNFELVYSINDAANAVGNLNRAADQKGALPGEEIWTADLPVLQQGQSMRYFLRVKGTAGAWTLFPDTAPGDPLRLFAIDKTVEYPVVINEIMPANTSAFADPAGEFDDWLELYNPADSIVSLKGMYLSDNPQNQRKWALPDTALQARSYLIIWADENGRQGPMHANFKLNRRGEFLGLFAPERVGNFVIDSLTFAASQNDYSLARNTDGGERWVQTTTPTPGAPNIFTAVAVNDGNEPANNGHFHISAPFPNPAIDTFKLQIETATNRKLEVSIISITGATEKELAFDLSTGQTELQINCAGLPVGIYLLLVKSGQNKIAQKITVLH